MRELLVPYQFEFFRNGLIVATIAGALCGLVGVFVVQRGMSYIGHGLSHAIFGGFAVSALVGVSYFIGAGLWGIAAAFAINGVTRRKTIGADAAIGVVTTASFALGLALFAVFGRAGRSFDAALFGSVLGVSSTDVLVIAGVAVAATLVVVFQYRPLLFTTFDPEVAAASGIRTARVEGLLMLILAATILSTMRVLGVTLIAATIVIPAVVARMLTDSFGRLLVYSTIIGGACGAIGMNLSYHADIQSGPTIVLTGASFFIVAFAVSSVRAARRRRRPLAALGA